MLMPYLLTVSFKTWPAFFPGILYCLTISDQLIFLVGGSFLILSLHPVHPMSGYAHSVNVILVSVVLWVFHVRERVFCVHNWLVILPPQEPT